MSVLVEMRWPSHFNAFRPMMLAAEGTRTVARVSLHGRVDPTGISHPDDLF
jgi:hypothetical protein